MTGMWRDLRVAVAGLLESLLFSVQPTDPVTLGVVAVVPVATASAAAAVPAWRGTQVDPMVAFRAEG